MLSAVIIILREVLEAGLIISVLLASSRGLTHDRRWALAGLLIGVIGAAATASRLDVISDWAEGIGQELFNAALLMTIVALLAAYNAVTRLPQRHATVRVLFALTTAVIACAVIREGSEILIYGYGFAGSFHAFLPVLIGGGIGVGIGASIAALLYYGLVYLPRRSATLVMHTLIILIAGGMAAEAAMYLTQAGLLPADEPLWNTSDWLPERSVLGQLLYALIGYEATPTLYQVAFYVATAVLMIAATWLARAKTSPSD